MKQRYLILFSLSGLILSLDQLSKNLVRLYLKEGIAKPLIPGFFSLLRSHGNGFGFGMLQRAPASLQDMFFIAVPIFALILIVLIFIRIQDPKIWTSIALTTIFSGAIGNLIDRFRSGYVIDFFKVEFFGLDRIPAFNLADCSIILGVLIMFLNTLKEGRSGGSNLESAGEQG